VASVRSSDLPEAAAQLRQAILLEPGNGDFYAELGDVLLNLSRYEEAAAALQTAAFLKPERPHVFCRLAQALVEERQREEALAALKAALERRPNCPDALAVRGEQFLRDDNLTAAQADFKRVVELEPGFALAYQKLGYILLETNQTDAAIPVLQKGLAASPNHPGLHFLLGHAYSKRPSDPQSQKLAEQEYRLSLPGNPEAAQARAALGQLYLRAGRLREAGEEYEQALTLSPYLKDALYGLTQVREREGKPEEAARHRKMYDRFLAWERQMAELQARADVDRDNVDLQVRLAGLLLEKGLYKQAGRPLHTAVSMDPAHRKARELRARVFEGLGEVERANRELAVASRLPRHTP
jgi:tetratricopeptide (TPR) repeat protein